MVQVEAVSELIKAGKIRHWGLSNETAYGVTMFCETAKRLGVPLPITIQNDYSLCERCVCLPSACTCLLTLGDAAPLVSFKDPATHWPYCCLPPFIHLTFLAF
jgi:hypothetical protein